MRRLGEAGGKQLGAVAGAAAEIGDAPRRRQRNAGEQIARRARPLGDELHVEGGIPVAGGRVSRGSRGSDEGLRRRHRSGSPQKFGLPRTLMPYER